LGNLRPNNTMAKDSQKSGSLIIANYKFDLAYYSSDDVKQLLIIKKSLLEPRARRGKYGTRTNSKIAKHAALVKLSRIAKNNPAEGCTIMRSDLNFGIKWQSVRSVKVHAVDSLRDEPQNSFEVRERREETLAEKSKSEEKYDPWADWDEQFAETIHLFKNPNVDPDKWGKKEEEILRRVEEMSEWTPKFSEEEVKKILVNGMLYID
jgi:hypothetical protein